MPLPNWIARRFVPFPRRSEEHTSELQSRVDLVCRLLLEKKKIDTLREHGLRPTNSTPTASGRSLALGVARSTRPPIKSTAARALAGEITTQALERKRRQ